MKTARRSRNRDTLEPRMYTDSTRTNAFGKKLNQGTPFEIVEICRCQEVKFLRFHLLNPCFIRANRWRASIQCVSILVNQNFADDTQLCRFTVRISYLFFLFYE